MHPEDRKTASQANRGHTGPPTVHPESRKTALQANRGPRRIERAAAEAAVLQTAGPKIRARTWSDHKHEFDRRSGTAPGETDPATVVGDAEVAPGAEVDFDTDLMRLATGGS